MPHVFRVAPVVVLATALVGADAPREFAQNCPAGASVAFVGADVLTMSDTVLRRNQTVLVEAGRISAIGSPALPPGTCRVDAAGRTLLPGLADIHAHTTESELPLFLANGVTLVREMNGTPGHVALRARLASGKVLGPRLVVTSPLLTGKKLPFRYRLIESASDADAAAKEAKQAGYDFLKIYDDLSAEAYETLVAAGRSLGLPLDGHIPRAVGIERVIASGQALQHMDKIAMAIAGHQADLAKLEDARRIFAGKRVWVTPTLASLRALDGAGTPEYAASLTRPEMAYVDSGTLGWWKSLVGSGTRAYARSPLYRFETGLLPVLRDAGVRFLVGTDAANPLMVAGFSVHDEFDALVRDGGFSRYEALLAATRNAAEFLGDADGGEVRVGARADLLLVDTNPLDGLATLRQPVGVMVGGRWVDRTALAAGLKSAIRSAPGGG